jgi:hypothetical protein
VRPLFLALLVVQGEPHFDPAVHEATKTIAFEDFLVVPVRVHLWRCKAEESLDTRLEEKDVRRIFGKANRIWNRAGIGLRLESIVTEEIGKPEGFDAAKAVFPDYTRARPAAGLAEGMIHVYYVRQLQVNGFYVARDAIFVKDAAALRPVKGGVDEPVPRVTSHEIGHAMTLPHRQDTINLMASGTTGWSLNDEEIGKVRAWASKQTWVLTAKAAFEQKHFEFLASLPGESPLKEEARKALAERR